MRIPAVFCALLLFLTTVPRGAFANVHAGQVFAQECGGKTQLIDVARAQAKKGGAIAARDGESAEAYVARIAKRIDIGAHYTAVSEFLAGAMVELPGSRRVTFPAGLKWIDSPGNPTAPAGCTLVVVARAEMMGKKIRPGKLARFYFNGKVKLSPMELAAVYLHLRIISSTQDEKVTSDFVAELLHAEEFPQGFFDLPRSEALVGAGSYELTDLYP